jgi:hypothetical protein
MVRVLTELADGRLESADSGTWTQELCSHIMQYSKENVEKFSDVERTGIK